MPSHACCCAVLDATACDPMGIVAADLCRLVELLEVYLREKNLDN